MHKQAWICIPPQDQVFCVYNTIDSSGSIRPAMQGCGVMTNRTMTIPQARAHLQHNDAAMREVETVCHWGLSLIEHINGGSLLRRASFRRNTRPRLQSQSSSPGGRAHAKPYRPQATAQQNVLACGDVTLGLWSDLFSDQARHQLKKQHQVQATWLRQI
ncbi:hypothetical protein J7T55_012844 [Diaporthe amygdali]|uniref:uncharacterized protein n=1 Tax=Phomopsis amygdali TaxID=1214568 RepID=UPI0022FDE352|nr:uncharacterized protein J7T55_012844 [Diaporthe amygdali]KAJ0118592.1 hypothetical protein J7T55_012844 [Diaporthe amygdali]